MFCHQCGQALAAEAAACTSCGKAVGLVPSPAPTAGAQEIGKRLANEAKAASQNALQAFTTFAVNPVGGLRSAFTSLGPTNARNAGFVFALFFDFCLVIGMHRAASAGRGMLPFAGMGSAGFSLGDTLKLLLAGLVPFAGIVGAGLGARKIFHGASSIEGDIFVAGAALLPTAFLVFLAGILGIANFEVVAILSVVAICYTVLMLHTG